MTQNPQPEPPKPMHWGKKLAIAFGVLVFIAACVVGAPLLTLNTAWGRGQLAQVIDDLDGVALEGISGNLFGQITLEGLALTDDEGPWLTVPQARVRWSPWPLLTRHVKIDDIQIPTIEIARPPNSAPQDPDAAPFELTDITHQPVSATLQNLEIQTITWQAQAGRKGEITLAATGGLKRGEALEFALALVPISQGISDEINADVVLNTADAFASTDITITASADGLIAGLLGLPGATNAALQGQGTPEAWSAIVKADVTGQSVADVTASYRAPEGQASGHLNLRPFIDPLTLDLLTSRFALNAQYKTASAGSVDLDASLGNEAIASTIKGALSLVERRPAAQNLKINTVINGAAGDAALEDVQTDIILNGDTADLTAELGLKAVAVSWDTIGAKSADITATVRQVKGTLAAELAGKLGAVTGVDAIQDPALLENIAFKGQAERSVDGALTAAAQASNDHFNIAMSDAAQDATGALSAIVTAAFPDLTALPGALEAAATARTRISSTPGGQLAATLTSTITPRAGTQHWIGRLATDALKVGAKVTIDGERLAVRDIALNSDRAQIKGRAALDGTDIDAALSGTMEEAVFLDAASGANSQPAQFDITANGPLETVMPRGSFNIPGYRAAGLEMRGIAVQFSRGPANAPSATRLALEGRSSAGPLRASALIERRINGAITVDALDARLANVAASGHLDINAEGTPSGAATVSVVPLTYAQSGLFELSGDIKIEAALTGGDDAKLTFSGGGPSLVYGPDSAPTAQLRALQLDGSLDLATETPALVATFNAKAVEAGGLFFDQVALQAASDGAEQTALITLQQAGFRPTNAVLNITVQSQAQATNVTIDPSGEIAAFPLASDAPLNVTIDTNAITLDPAKLTIGGGRIAVEAQQTPQQLKADINIAELQLRTLTDLLQQPALYGNLNAQMALDSQANTGAMLAKLKIADLALEEQTAMPVAADMVLTAQRDMLQTKVNISHPQSADAVNASVALPISWPAEPSVFSVSANDELSGTVSIDTRLAPLWALANQIDQTLEGALTGDIALTGTLEAIKPDGTITLAAARYENLELGTQLNDLNAVVGLTAQQLMLQSLNANDGRGGSLSATASAGLFPFVPQQSKILLQDFQLLAKEGLTARADADLSLASVQDRLALKGDITIAEARYAIAASGAAAVPTLPIEEINKAVLDGDEPGTLFVEPQQSDPDRSGALPPIDLDIRLKAARRIFVTGMGLTSEWRTQLDVDGTTQTPSIAGQIQLIRGELEFAGKRFQLERGQIFLDGGQEIEPRLDILAQNTQGDFTARIAITGTPSDPLIALSSTPALPDDEILSRILFGTSASDLSALEAVQLGSAVAALSSGGGSSALDIAGKARSATGLDRLSLGSNDSSTAITGGKYLSPNVYLQFTTDPGSGQYLAAIEWYVTRTLSLLSEYGAETGSNVAARWSRTY